MNKEELEKEHLLLKNEETRRKNTIFKYLTCGFNVLIFLAILAAGLIVVAIIRTSSQKKDITFENAPATCTLQDEAIIRDLPARPSVILSQQTEALFDCGMSATP